MKPILDENAFGIFQSGHHENNKYELIYVRGDQLNGFGNEEGNLWKSEELFVEFNRDCLRPSDYYGYSLSVGDVIGYYFQGEFSAYEVQSIGFTKKDDFLTEEMKQKILTREDVRVEMAALEAKAKGERLSKDLAARLTELEDFKGSFSMADKRAIFLGEREPEITDDREVEQR